MKEAIGGTWLFQIVIVFILLFAGFLTFAINYTKAFKVKNEMVNIIERNQGFTSSTTNDFTTENEITNYLNTVGYRTTGKCDADEIGYPLNVIGDKHYYCVKTINTRSSEIEDQSYYRVKVFFNIDIPVVGEWFNFSVSGTTKIINSPMEKVGVIL